MKIDASKLTGQLETARLNTTQLSRLFDGMIEASFAGGPMPSPSQRREMKRAFMGGAQSIYTIMMDVPDAGPSFEDVQKMAGLIEELENFPKLVLAGEA